LGKSVDELDSPNDSGQFMKLVQEGHRLVLISKKPNPTDKGLFMKTLIEIVDFPYSPENFFEEETMIPEVHSKILLDQDLSYHCNGSKLALYDQIEGIKGMAMFFMMDLEKDPVNPTITSYKTTYPIHGLTHEKGFISYTTRIESGEGIVLEKLGTATPLIVLSEADQEKPAYGPILDLINTIGSGYINVNHGILTYVKERKKVVFDTNTNILQQFHVDTTLNSLLSTDSSREVFCDSQTFKVQSLKTDALESSELNLSISTAPFRP
jgi:hypothetical protein